MHRARPPEARSQIDAFPSPLSLAPSLGAVSLYRPLSLASFLVNARAPGCLQGIKVDGYSVGFGPALFSTQGPGGVTYSLRLVPLGGFVAFPPHYKNPETEDQFKV